MTEYDVTKWAMNYHLLKNFEKLEVIKTKVTDTELFYVFLNLKFYLIYLLNFLSKF
jgi:hypothetical protein